MHINVMLINKNTCILDNRNFWQFCILWAINNPKWIKILIKLKRVFSIIQIPYNSGQICVSKLYNKHILGISWNLHILHIRATDRKTFSLEKTCVKRNHQFKEGFDLLLTLVYMSQNYIHHNCTCSQSCYAPHSHTQFYRTAWSIQIYSIKIE